MIGILIALGCAIAEATKNILSKHRLNKNIDDLIVTWSMYIFALPFLILYLVLSGGGIPKLGEHFWILSILEWTINLVAIISLVKAIKLSDLSKTLPLMAFTPLFLLITSPIMLGEFPPLLGLLGVLLIISGSYMLNFNEKRLGWLMPFKAMVREPGPRYALFTAFLYSISSNISKLTVQASSPFFWALVGCSFMTVALLVICVIKVPKTGTEIKIHFKSLWILGFMNSLAFITQSLAVTHILVIYVISIKRFSIVLAVLLGYLIFKETSFRERMAGAIIMFTGVLLIALSQTL